MTDASLDKSLLSTSQSNNERVNQIKKEFSDIDTNQDQQLSFEEINSYLSKKCRKPFNPILLNEIFKTLDKDQNSLVSLDEFVSGYYQAETLVKSRIDQLKIAIAENTQKLSDTRRQFIEAKASRSERQNVLTVTVKKAEGLKAAGLTGNKAPLVKVSCESQEITTQPFPNPKSPTWNETFSFFVSSGTGKILIEVFDSDRGKPSAFLGEVSIPFNALTDQQLHEDALDLIGKNPADKVSGKIYLAFQWIYDLPKYLEGLINQFHDIIDEDKSELLEMEKYYKDLESIFGGTGEWILSNPMFQRTEQQFSAKMDDVAARAFGVGSIKWSFANQLSIYLLLLLSTLSMFARPDFANLWIGILAVYYYITHTNVAFHYKLLAFAVIISQIYDLIWIWIYLSVIFMQKWMEGSEVYDDGVKRFAAVISVINFIGKFIFGAIFWKNSIELS